MLAVSRRGCCKPLIAYDEIEYRGNRCRSLVCRQKRSIAIDLNESGCFMITTVLDCLGGEREGERE